jgi:hypothetical protein
MPIINHQLINKSFFIPDWDCKTLVLGTFNPEGGHPVNYFYGRDTNYFWKAISYIDNKEEHFYHKKISNNQDDHFLLMKKNKFGCTDIIKCIDCPIEAIPRINGGGYPDQLVFRANIERQYNFEDLEKYINRQNQKEIRVKKIINTVGNRFDNPAPNEFAEKLNKFKLFCQKNKIDFISSQSASAHAVRTHKTEFETLKIFYQLHLFSI